jgi:hypothetical protein
MMPMEVTPKEMKINIQSLLQRQKQSLNTRFPPGIENRCSGPQLLNNLDPKTLWNGPINITKTGCKERKRMGCFGFKSTQVKPVLITRASMFSAGLFDI